MVFWVCSGVAGKTVFDLGREPRKVLYQRRASHFLDMASKVGQSEGKAAGVDPNELLSVVLNLVFMVWAKSVFKGGRAVRWELEDGEVAQVLYWRKEMAFAITEI
jgi:hypothetical protein